MEQKFTKFSTWFTVVASSHPNRAGTLDVYIGVIGTAPAALDTKVPSRSVHHSVRSFQRFLIARLCTNSTTQNGQRRSITTGYPYSMHHRLPILHAPQVTPTPCACFCASCGIMAPCKYKIMYAQKSTLVVSR